MYSLKKHNKQAHSLFTHVNSIIKSSISLCIFVNSQATIYKSTKDAGNLVQLVPRACLYSWWVLLYPHYLLSTQLYCLPALTITTLLPACHSCSNRLRP